VREFGFASVLFATKTREKESAKGSGFSLRVATASLFRAFAFSQQESHSTTRCGPGVDRVTKPFDLEPVFRPRGRPCKESQNNGF